MKKMINVLALLALVIGASAQETHFDFAVTSMTGYEYYFRIIDAEQHWVEATYPCQHGDYYWWGYDKPEGKLVLTETVTHAGVDYTLVAIGDHAFCDCSGLSGKLELPSTITAIGAGAFKGCSRLSGDLNLPASMTRIEDEAFSGCTTFSGGLFLPHDIQDVGYQAFFGCSGFDGMVRMPAALATIGEEAFKGCSGIRSISAKMNPLPTLGANAFEGVPSWITVYVPYNMKEAYQNAAGWSSFASRIIEKSFWMGDAEPWTHGSGTEDDPYLIESAENLAWLEKQVNEKPNMTIYTECNAGGMPYLVYFFDDVYAFRDTCFRLVIDIDLRQGERCWTPIGNNQYLNPDNYPAVIRAPHRFKGRYYYTTCFSGQFDGNGHVISYVDYQTDFDPQFALSESEEFCAYYVGLFGLVDNATLQHLTIDHMLSNPYYKYATGGLVAKAVNSTLYDCSTSGTIYKSNYGGGLVSIAENCCLERCKSQVNLRDNFKAGGIVAQWVCDTAKGACNKLFDCGFTGNIQSAYTAGGIVGFCKSVAAGNGVLQVERCFSKGTLKKVMGTYHYFDSYDTQFGGIVGQVGYIDTLCILNCYSNDTLTGIGTYSDHTEYYIGGVLGRADANTTLYIKNCYHVGPITSKTYKGGILAEFTNMTRVRNCFIEDGCAPDNGFGLPVNADEMKTAAFVNRLNNGSSVYQMDMEPYVNDGFPVFGDDGLIFVGAEWYYEIQNPDGSVTYQHLQCTGDTIVNDKKAKVIVRTNQIYDKGVEVSRECVYEENGVVYWWNNTLKKFTVLYDFGAEVGDEWIIEVGDNSIVVHVYESDLQYIDGIPYKRLTIADPDDVFSGVVLSKIGHLTSFFPESMISQSKGYRVEGLRCYWFDNALVLKMGEMDCDEIYDQYHHGVDEIGEGGFVVYPNPTDGLVHVEVSHGAAPQEYRITNLMGQTLMSGTVSDQTIDVSTLPKGLYFITLDNQTIKLMKQ